MSSKQIEKRLEEIERLLVSLDKTLAINTEHLAEHMRRTAIIEDELKPVVKHVEQMRGAGKLIALLALLATILSVILIFN
jgi:predicted neutral ceramidase superfamily lipid hydrolase